MHKIRFFPENLEQILGFTSKFKQGRVTLYTGFILFGLLRKTLSQFMIKAYAKDVDECLVRPNLGIYTN